MNYKYNLVGHVIIKHDYRTEKKGNEMLIVGEVSTDEERDEAIYIAQVFTVEERIRYIARINRKE